MCLTSTTVRPRLSEQLGVSLLCTGHCMCPHPLQSDLVYPNNGVSLLCTPYCMCLTSTTSDLVYPNNLVSLYSVLVHETVWVSHIHYILRPRLSEQLGVSLLCTGHTVCVSHPLQSDLVYPNNLVSLYSVLKPYFMRLAVLPATANVGVTW